MKKQIQTARGHCANYNNGKCVGAMFNRDEKNTLHTWIDPKYAGKQCVLERQDKQCPYFNNFVVPGISVESKWK